MPFQFVTLQEARKSTDLVLVASAPGVPNPWVEAVKGIFHAKQVPFVAVHTNYDDPEFMEWAGSRGAPVILHGGRSPIDRWNDILLFAERKWTDRPLLPVDAQDRAMVIGLCHELAGEQGLGWTRRLNLVHRALQGEGHAFASFATGLGAKYGYRAKLAPAYEARVCALLDLLARRLHLAEARGSGYLVGDELSAADIYCAVFLVQFGPLPAEQCPMLEPLRRDFEGMSPAISKALDSSLLAHRARIYRDHMELPLTL